jgi:CRP/FNR family transcriptional regulator
MTQPIGEIQACAMCQQSSGCFSKLVSDELDFLSAHKKQLVYQKGENICKQGAFAPYVLYVVNGMVRLFVESGPEKHLNIAVQTAGSFIGFSTVFGENVYQYSAVAINDATICMIDKDGLKNLFYKNADFALSIISRNCRNEKQLLKLLRTIAHKQMPGKLATALLYLNEEDLIKQDIFTFLTRKELSDFAGITVESTVKLLKEFQKDKLIQLEGKQIIIADVKRLQDVALHG